MLYIGILIILIAAFIFTQSRSIDKAWVIVLAVGVIFIAWGMK
jgi:hypothetical protein